ncbi:hypothetical protein JCM10213_000479 [Rhodosporidiobolus nylandii]
MQESAILLASLLSVLGSAFLVLALSFARFAYRKHKKGRAEPVDPAYEKTQVDLVAAQAEAESEGKKRWFAGAWGVTPVAEVGPGGTKQYFSGWFGLDAPSTAGWSRSDEDGTFSSTYGASSSPGPPTWRDSHFSRASRASRRSALSRDGSLTTPDEGKKEKKGRKKPRVSRTTELGMLERDEGSGEEVEGKGEGLLEQEKRAIEEVEGEKDRLTARE